MVSGCVGFRVFYLTNYGINCNECLHYFLLMFVFWKNWPILFYKKIKSIRLTNRLLI